MTRLTLCLNCLAIGATAIPVGHAKGNQFDSYHETLDLCPECKQALQAGDFATLAARHTNERTITVGAQGGR